MHTLVCFYNGFIRRSLPQYFTSGSDVHTCISTATASSPLYMMFTQPSFEDSTNSAISACPTLSKLYFRLIHCTPTTLWLFSISQSVRFRTFFTNAGGPVQYQNVPLNSCEQKCVSLVLNDQFPATDLRIFFEIFYEKLRKINCSHEHGLMIFSVEKSHLSSPHTYYSFPRK